MVEVMIGLAGERRVQRAASTNNCLQRKTDKEALLHSEHGHTTAVDIRSQHLVELYAVVFVDAACISFTK